MILLKMRLANNLSKYFMYYKLDLKTTQKKLKLAFFSLTGCKGCQFAILNHYDTFNQLLNFFEIENFLSKKKNKSVFFDVSVIEGTPESEKEINQLKNIRKQSKVVISMGSCAHLGGIQSQRNRLPRKYIGKENVKTVLEIIKIDYILPGCPVDYNEFFKCLMDIYWGKIFRLPDYSVCSDCRQNDNECLIKQGKACLGPITRGGCNSICINRGDRCYGCRGAIDQANFNKMVEVLEPIISRREIENLLSIFGDIRNDHNNTSR